MSEKQNIDKLFKEKLGEFEATPSASVWDNISQEIGQGGEDRKAIPIWWKIVGVAAGVILLITVGTTLLNKGESENIPDQNVVDIESQVSPDDSTRNEIDQDTDGTLTETETPGMEVISKEKTEASLTGAEESGITDPDNQNEGRSKTAPQNAVAVNSGADEVKKSSDKVVQSEDDKREAEKTDDLIDSAIVERNRPETAEEMNKQNLADPSEEGKIIVNDKSPVDQNLHNVETQVADSGDEQKTHENITEDAQQSIEDAVAVQDESELDEKEESGNRWSVTPQVAPVYFNSLGSGSAIDGEFAGNSRTGEINMNYGIIASYDFNEKLTLRAGVNQMNLSYRTNDVIVYNNVQPNTGEKPLKNVNLNDESMDLSFISSNGLNVAQVPGVVAANIESSIDQEIGFIEIPLELEYKLSDRKVGISIIGGMSTLFLSENRIYSSLQGQRSELGEASNISSTSFSANLGMGMNVKLSESIDLNLEPVFKYQLNTFKDTNGNFNPYTMGIYTGLSFKF